jgi:hypothetical protein
MILIVILARRAGGLNRRARFSLGADRETWIPRRH